MDAQFHETAAAAPTEPAGTAMFVSVLRQLIVAGSLISTGWLAAQAPIAPALWPPAGIALAALFFWGSNIGFALIFGGIALARLMDASWPLAIELGLVQWLAPALSMSLMRRCAWRQGERPLRDLVLLLSLGVGLTALLNGGARILLAHEPFSVVEADVAALLLIAAPLLHLESPRLPRPGTLPWLFAPALLGAPAFFWPGLEAVLCIAPLAVLALALRGEALLGSAAALVAAVLAALATGFGFGPFAGSNAGLVQLSSGLAALALVAPMVGTRLLRRDERNRRWVQALQNEGTALAEWHVLHGMRPSANWETVTMAPLPADSDPVHWLAVAHPLDRERVVQQMREALAPDGEDLCHEALRLPSAARSLAPVHGTGAWCWHALRLHVLRRDREGRAAEALLLLSDINTLRQAEDRQMLAAGLFQHLHEGVLIVDGQHRVVDLNPSYCRIMGARREALIGRPAELLLSPTLHRSGASTEQMMAALHAEGHWSVQLQTERDNGSACTLQMTISEVRQPAGGASQRLRVVTVNDLTEILEQRERIEQQSSKDALTGLPNHEEFAKLLRQSVATAEHEGFMLCVCRIDLDQFKLVNARFGVEQGDELLLQVARRLQAALRHAEQWSDRIARLAGDEFGLILRVADASEAQLALERMLGIVRTTSMLSASDEAEGAELSASIGATLYPTDRSDAETLLRHAGHALYRVKQHSGRNAFRFFDAAKRQRDEASLMELARMQQALDQGELLLYYQPKIDMHEGRVLGMEALLRWQHPERGLLMPGAFLPQIEDTGLAVQVGDWIIDQALKQSAQWLASGLELEVSVNVTARQLHTPDFAQRLQELVHRHPEPVARHLCLEVLESAALADTASVHTLIERCQAFGVRFALDDFGTGYSTLAYLKSLPVDTLKIDRSFVQNMLIDAQDMALIEGVVGLARHFGCSVVAEGVESAAHARALLRLGCSMGQGNGVAAAMPAAEVASWCEAFARSPWLRQLDVAHRVETVD
ncbi:MAG: EAL domain-containing protein [Paucibacter sp.]|nr:EAL domain-containing protein [Roseateles sp.]